MHMIPLIILCFAGELKDRRKSDVEDEDDELERSGCLGLGLIRDMKRRYPLYLSDIKDGINFQCLSVIMFIFFAALSPAVTFGADIGLYFVPVNILVSRVYSHLVYPISPAISCNLRFDSIEPCCQDERNIYYMTLEGNYVC